MIKKQRRHAATYKFRATHTLRTAGWWLYKAEALAARRKRFEEYHSTQT